VQDIRAPEAGDEVVKDALLLDALHLRGWRRKHYELPFEVRVGCEVDFDLNAWPKLYDDPICFEGLSSAISEQRVGSIWGCDALALHFGFHGLSRGTMQPK
jgi:hypothetical protein